jgi:hypothetical protein
VTHPALSLVNSIAETRAQLEREPLKLARLQSLQRWQVQRLQRTYMDYYELPRYRDAIEFFVHDLYGPHDYAQRDRDIQRVIEPWQRILPMRAMQAVATALSVESLTQQLDLAMLDALGERAINQESYAHAYRFVNRRQDRERQIALIVDCGKALDALIANPWVRRALRLAKIPARLANVSVLHEFLERGYEAFEKMGGARELLGVIELRETTIMHNLLVGSADPFSVAEIEGRAIGSSNVNP